MRSKLPVSAALLLALVLENDPSAASDPLNDRLSLSLGGFLLTTDTRVRIDGSARTGTEFDVEEELGFNDTDRFRLDAYWRFQPRHKLRIMYFDTRRTASRQIDREITVRDTTYAVDTRIDAGFDTTIAELAYEYAFLQGERYELAGTVGVHNLRFDLGLSGTGTGTASAAAANGPLPVSGVRGIWRFTDTMYADAQVQYFEISLDPYDGSVEDYNASIVWQAFEHLGFGLGYNAFAMRVDVEDDDFNGHLRWRYDGARVFAVASF